MEKKEFNILVAEDDRIVQDVIVKFLSDEGYPVAVASDGLAALKHLRIEDIQLVLTDLRMPGADGMEVLRTAKQINPRISVVMLTAYGTLDTALDAMKEGAYDYIVKPFVMQQLLLVVRNAFAMASLVRDHEKLSAELRELNKELKARTGCNAELPASSNAHSIAGIDELQRHNVINDEEARMLKERVTTDSVDNKLKQFSSLVNHLRDGYS